MAFLFATSFFLFSVLVHSLSDCYSIGPADSLIWNYNPGTFIENLGPKLGVSTFSGVCSKLNQARSQKIICLFCKGFHASCFSPPASTTITIAIPTIPTTIPLSTSTTPATSTTTSTAAPPPPPPPPEE